MENRILSAGKKELWLAGILLAAALFFADCFLFAGLNLGFAIGAIALIVTGIVYLRLSGGKFTGYCAALLILSLVLAGAFVRSDDALIKFALAVCIFLAVPLGLTILAGKTRRKLNSLASLLDSFHTGFFLGFDRIADALTGLVRAGKGRGGKWKAFLLGLAVAVPTIALLLPLLMRADAAFEGFLKLLPQINWLEPFAAIFMALLIAPVIYTVCVALSQKEKPQAAGEHRGRIPTLTVHTVLGAVVAMYGVYLLSQLAYVFTDLRGVLPEEYTLAEYARRGFFEMILLSFLTLSMMTGATALVRRKDGKAPLATRILCLFLGLMTLFFVVSSGAKMMLYIDSYGLTRLRVLTQIVGIFLGLADIFLMVWLIAPKFPCVKSIFLTALILCSIVAWADVDTVVAKYNVYAYQTGILETVDVSHLASLSSGALPYLNELTDSRDPEVARDSLNYLNRVKNRWEDGDWRSFTIANSLAQPIWETLPPPIVVEDWEQSQYQPVNFYGCEEEFTVVAKYLLDAYPENAIISLAYASAGGSSGSEPGFYHWEDGEYVFTPCPGEVYSAVETIRERSDWQFNLEAALVGNGQVQLFHTGEACGYCLSQWSEYPIVQNPGWSIEQLNDHWFYMTKNA